MPTNMQENKYQTYMELIKEEKIKKLTDVGFTKEQAEVLIDTMQLTSFSGGLF